VIVVRSEAEAAVYCQLTGHGVISRRSPRPGAHVWECMWRDEPRQLVFVEMPSDEPSRLVDRDGFAQVGAELLGSVPATPLGFVRGKARRCIGDLVLAAYALGEALRLGPDEVLSTALERANARRGALGEGPKRTAWKVVARNDAPRASALRARLSPRLSAARSNDAIHARIIITFKNTRLTRA
jgi:hypothetical protein